MKFLLSSLALFLFLPFAHTQAASCSEQWNFDADGFIQPTDVFENTSLVETNCGTQSANITVGTSTNDKTLYIWKKLYHTVDGKNLSNNVVDLEGETDSSGKWIIGEGIATLQASHNQEEYVAAYICRYIDDDWKCGCSSTQECSKTAWYLERFALPEEVGNEKITNCGKSIKTTGDDTPALDCFINNVCRPAELVTEFEIDLFGIVVRSEAYREIKGIENERCILYQRTDDISHTPSEELKQKMLDEGMTEEEINQGFLEMTEEAKEDFVGIETTCRYPIDDLIDMLEEEKKGNFSGSTDDMEKYQCTTSYFDKN